MRIKTFYQYLSLKLSRIREILIHFASSLPGILALLVAVFTVTDLLLKWGVLRTILAWLSVALAWVVSEVSASPLIFVLFLVTSFFVWVTWKRLQIVAGEFRDDFTGGLYNWEFGGEGWKIEHDGNLPVLSVSESSDGGITKKGFSWSDYEFSFDTKVIKDASSWIVRAENRNKYFMIQLSVQDPENSKLRPHYRWEDQEYPWIAVEDQAVNLNEVPDMKIQRLEWIRVRVVVRGSTVDTFLNGKHALHFFLPDPARFAKDTEITTPEGKKTPQRTLIVLLGYAAGRVGFRCAAQEHAHFRHVRVKPL